MGGPSSRRWEWGLEPGRKHGRGSAAGKELAALLRGAVDIIVTQGAQVWGGGAQKRRSVGSRRNSQGRNYMIEGKEAKRVGNV